MSSRSGMFVIIAQRPISIPVSTNAPEKGRAAAHRIRRPAVKSKVNRFDDKVKNYINAFLCDNKLDSRTSCGRKFCAACLKANYEDNSYFLPKWTCPFCKVYIF